MESKKILNILEQFNGKNTYKKIFINGAWGIGKSYYANEYRKENKNIVYVSLFGKPTFDSIVESLSNELINKMKKNEKIFKSGKRVLSKLSGSLSYHGFSINTPSVKNKGLIQEYSKLLEREELIIMFDDLERKSINISMEDIMGLIEEFSSIEKVKIVIIGDENNISEEEKLKWCKFKEKIIEKEYKIDTFSYEAIESIVLNRLEKYISKNDLDIFIKEFLLKHKTSNLRTINKGINLFIEIIDNYLLEKYNEKIYLIILKNCMSVAIEYTEELYKPKETDKDSKDNTKSWAYCIDSEISSRIVSHYFGSVFMNHKDASILDYVIKFYNSEMNEDTINDFNNVIKFYLNVKEEKNIFYLSEKSIKNKINSFYNSIKNNEYVLTNLEEFMDEVYELINYNLCLSLKLKNIDKYVNDILFQQYYDVNKNEYQNKIDIFSAVKRESNELKEIIDKYNSNVEEKYYLDKINYIASQYKIRKYNTNDLEFIKNKVYQQDSQKVKEYFLTICKKNNF